MATRPLSPRRWGLGLQLVLLLSLGLWWWRRDAAPPPAGPPLSKPQAASAPPAVAPPPASSPGSAASPASLSSPEDDRARALAVTLDASAAADPERVRQWQEQEPVAQHAARDADRWRSVGERLAAADQEALAIEARTLAMRLDRARVPVVASEAQAVLMAELDLLGRSTRLARDQLADPELLALLEDIQQGTHAALQHGPQPPIQVPPIQVQ